MKTFETEKKNIPQGATHYSNETVAVMFCWFKFKSDNWYVMTENDSTWHICNHNEWKTYGAKPITTETPEEKEALDAIEKLEWENGDECRYNDVNWLFCGFHPVNGLAIVANNDEPSSHQIITVDVELLSKPETPEAKKEREESEAMGQLVSMHKKAYGIGGEIEVNALILKAGYRRGE